MNRAVVDTNVLVSGVIVPHGAPHRILEAWQIGAYHGILVATPQEFVAVLTAEGRAMVAEPGVRYNAVPGQPCPPC